MSREPGSMSSGALAPFTRADSPYAVEQDALRPNVWLNNTI